MKTEILERIIAFAAGLAVGILAAVVISAPGNISKPVTQIPSVKIQSGAQPEKPVLYYRWHDGTLVPLEQSEPSKDSPNARTRRLRDLNEKRKAKGLAPIE